MASTYRVPTIFTAVDRVTSVVTRMTRGVTTFASRAEAGVSRANRAFNKFMPVFGEAGRQLLDTVKTAALAAVILGGITFSTKSLIDYETALASFRTIVSDLTNKEFSKYQNKINEVALDTKKSSVEVAASFEKIAGLNATFAKTAKGIGEVATASIVLAKASRDDLGTSAENLVGIMNQFNLTADQANRTINVLAAGQAVGAASISQTSEAFKNFGSVAKGSNITLEESVGLIQTLGKFSIFGAEAGTKLRGATLSLQKVGAGYASGQFSINDALAQVSKKHDKLSSQRKKDAFLLKIFGAENISVGKILLGNVGVYKDYTAGVTGTSEAQKAAAINSNTLAVKLDELKNRWVNYITSNDQANVGLIKVKESLAYITDNMDSLLSVGITFLKFFAVTKGILLATQAVLWLYNVALGVNGALTGIASVAIGKSAVALGAYNVVTKSVTAAQWLWNAAMTANPIGLIIVGIAALIALVAVIITKWDSWGASIALLLGPLGFVISLIQALRRNWDMITKSFKEGGLIEGIKAIGKVIFDALLQPLQQLLGLIGKVTGFKWATNASASINGFRESLGVSMESNSSDLKPALSAPAMKQTEVSMNSSQKNTLDVNFNDPGKMVSSTSMKGPLNIPIKIGATQGAN